MKIRAIIVGHLVDSEHATYDHNEVLLVQIEAEITSEQSAEE